MKLDKGGAVTVHVNHIIEVILTDNDRFECRALTHKVRVHRLLWRKGSVKARVFATLLDHEHLAPHHRETEFALRPKQMPKHVRQALKEAL